MRPHSCDGLCGPLIRRYEAGLGLEEVGAAVGLTGTAVRKRLMHHGIARRHQGWRAPTWQLEALRLWRDDGLTTTEIAQRVGKTKERVRQVLVQAGITEQRRHRCNDACEVVLAAPEPLTLLPLSRETGISDGRLQFAAAAHHLRTRPRYTKGHQCDHRCGAFLDLIRQGTSPNAAAKAVGWVPSFVSQRLRIYHPDWPWPPYFVKDKLALAERKAGA